MTITRRPAEQNSWAGTGTDIPRDHKKRPLVMKLDGSGQRTPYQRTTKFIDVLEDGYNLERYSMRTVAWGMSQREDLVLALAAYPDFDGGGSAEGKRAMNDIAWQAKQFARADAKATKGTALHKFTERMDRGETLGRVPEPHGADLRAYERWQKRYGVENLVIESFRVHDNWRVAGTTDRIVKIDGRYYIMDIKTGDIDWGALKMAMQLAMYRSSVPYDVTTDERGEDGVLVEPNRAIIVHLPAGQGRCESHWIDIGKGRIANTVAYQVWEQRRIKREELIQPMEDQFMLDVAADPVMMADKAAAEASTCGSTEELRDLYFRYTEMGVTAPEFVAAVKARKAYLADAR